MTSFLFDELHSMAIIANDTKVQEIGWQQREDLFNLLNSSTYEARNRSIIHSSIAFVESIEQYEFIKENLLLNQIGIEGAVNPSYREIWKHIKRFCK